MTANETPSQEYLLYRFHYDEDTGILTRRFLKGITKGERIINSRDAGKRAGRVNAYGYRVVSIDGVTYFEHRIVWKMLTGNEPSAELDHVGRDAGDNRATALRPATRSQNQCNTAIYKNNRSGYKGVGWHKAKRKWRGRIKKDGIMQELGYFDSAQEANAAVQGARVNLHGEFANSQ